MCHKPTWFFQKSNPQAVCLKAVSLKCTNSSMAEESWGGFFFLLEFPPNVHFGKLNAHPRKIGEFHLWFPCFQNLGVNYLSRFKYRSSIEICWCSNRFRLSWGWKGWTMPPLRVSVLELACEVSCAVAAVQLHLLLCRAAATHPKSWPQKCHLHLVRTYPVHVHSIHFTYYTNKNNTKKRSGSVLAVSFRVVYRYRYGRKKAQLAVFEKQLCINRKYSRFTYTEGTGGA